MTGARTYQMRQGGSTLITTLVLLIMITLLALSGINTSMGINHIVANAQFKEEARVAGQQAINTLISNISLGSDPVATAQQTPVVNIDINRDGVGDYMVTLYSTSPPLKPLCIAKASVPSKSAEFGVMESRYTTVIKSNTATAAEKAVAQANYNNLGTCKGKVPCYWTSWDIIAQVSDAYTGTSTEIHQGVKLFVSDETVSNHCNS